MKDTLALFNRLVEQLIEEETNAPVASTIDAKALFDTLNLELEDKASIEEDFQHTLAELVKYTPKTASKRFFNQLFGGRNEHAVLGDLLAVMLNNSMYTYKVAGPQVGVEKAVIQKSCELVGYGENSGGTFPTGGSMSNYMALVMARDAKVPAVQDEGGGQNLMAYTSEESHYSNAKNAAFAGIGRNNVRKIPADQEGRMRVDALERRIVQDLEEGRTPFYVNATAGTTVLGAFDPIEQIAALCKKYGLWLHVDGAYCGGVLFSKRYRHFLKGVEQADSFSYNAHKMLGTPLTCSIILVQDKKHLYNSFSQDASYLYQTDEDDFNLGKTSFQCGRRNDALKFWTLWKAVGTSGLADIVDKQFELAQVASTYVLDHEDYEFYGIKDSISVCFNYKGIDARKLCTALYEEQALMVGFGSFGSDTFVRLVTINAGNAPQDILTFFEVLERFVEQRPELLKEAQSALKA